MIELHYGKQKKRIEAQVMVSQIFINKPSKSTLAKIRKENKNSIVTIERIEMDFVKITIRRK